MAFIKPVDHFHELLCCGRDWFSRGGEANGRAVGLPVAATACSEGPLLLRWRCRGVLFTFAIAGIIELLQLVESLREGGVGLHQGGDAALLLLEGLLLPLHLLPKLLQLTLQPINFPFRCFWGRGEGGVGESVCLVCVWQYVYWWVMEASPTARHDCYCDATKCKSVLGPISIALHCLLRLCNNPSPHTCAVQ